MENERVVDETRPLLADEEQARVKKPKRATPLPVVQIGVPRQRPSFVHRGLKSVCRAATACAADRTDNVAKPAAVYQRGAFTILYMQFILNVIPQLISKLDIVNGDRRAVGYYAGIIVRLLHFIDSLRVCLCALRNRCTSLQKPAPFCNGDASQITSAVSPCC